MKKRMIKGLLSKTAIRKMTALLITSVIFFSCLTPVSAWANVMPKEDECICEHNCIEGGLNTDCPVCRQDIMRCEGLCTIEDEDPVEEKEPVRKERQKMGPLTPSGNMTLVDDYGSDEKEGKPDIFNVRSICSKSQNSKQIFV